MTDPVAGQGMSSAEVLSWAVSAAEAAAAAGRPGAAEAARLVVEGLDRDVLVRVAGCLAALAVFELPGRLSRGQSVGRTLERLRLEALWAS